LEVCGWRACRPSGSGTRLGRRRRAKRGIADACFAMRLTIRFARQVLCGHLLRGPNQLLFEPPDACTEPGGISPGVASTDGTVSSNSSRRSGKEFVGFTEPFSFTK